MPPRHFRRLLPPLAQESTVAVSSSNNPFIRPSVSFILTSCFVCVCMCVNVLCSSLYVPCIKAYYSYPLSHCVGVFVIIYMRLDSQGTHQTCAGHNTVSHALNYMRLLLAFIKSPFLLHLSFPVLSNPPSLPPPSPYSSASRREKNM